MTNMATKPMANNMGVCNRILPSHIVPNQLKILMPVGMAMVIVDSPNAAWATVPMPEENMWWAHTPKPRKAMAAPANTTAAYPNSGFRLNTGSTSETIPIAGRMRM